MSWFNEEDISQNVLELSLEYLNSPVGYGMTEFGFRRELGLVVLSLGITMAKKIKILLLCVYKADHYSFMFMLQR